MRVLFVQQDHVSPPGHVGVRFEERGYEVEEFLVVPEDRFADPGVTVTFPAPTDYDAVVAMGAPWSVYDEVRIGTWIRDEIAFLRGAHTAGVPVLGICFGGQALAAALGGAVERADVSEVGWYAVTSAEPHIIEEGPWFEWHQDRWRLPPGARLIARTTAAEQAFVIGRSLAIQFHPELTPMMLQGWLHNGGRGYLESQGVDPAELMSQTVRTEDEAAARTGRLVDRFLDHIATAEE